MNKKIYIIVDKRPYYVMYFPELEKMYYKLEGGTVNIGIKYIYCNKINGIKKLL